MERPRPFAPGAPGAPGRWAALGALGLGLLAGCQDQGQGTPDAGMSYPPLTIQSVNTRAVVADQMRAAIEMQQSGEPLATTMGRDITKFVHYDPIPDQYIVTTGGDTHRVIDPTGFSTAVESYEYSKMAMNHLSFEAGAGLSLMYGPRLNPGGLSGAAALGLLRDRIQHLALTSRAGSTGPLSPWVVVPAPTDNPMNRLGFPGLWPQFAEFRSYDPAIMPSREVQTRCTGTGANGGFTSVTGYAGVVEILINDYECSENSLHLLDRDHQAEKVLQIDALGLAAWKQALWIINYFQLVHDVKGRSMTVVHEADLPMVGVLGNTVQASDGDWANPGFAGTYIGSTDLEGFQGLVMTEEIDNKAALLLRQLTTADGATLGGFPDLKTALAYDYQAPLRWFPHAVAVTEQSGADGADPQPAGFVVQDGKSDLPDLTALLGAYAEVFALTDGGNAQVGGSLTVRPVFDGDPFPADDGMPDGEATLHDRALAVLKVALVNLDRLHLDPKSGALCDTAQVSGQGQGISRSSHVTTVETVYALVALRAAYRSLTSQLTLYSDATPDRAALHSALDGTSMAGAPGGAGVAARLQQILKAQAALLGAKLVGADGLAVNGYDVAAGAADATPTTLESQAAAVRGLLEAYVVTSDSSYRTRARQAYAVLGQRFYQNDLRVYRPVLGEDTTFAFTPPRFGILQSALRAMYVQVATQPGNDALRAELEARLGRLNKLVLNGWDDRNGDGKVDYTQECMRVEGGLPRSGLQMGERSLTGDIGWDYYNMGVPHPTADYDRDCVPNLSYVNLPAILAAEVRLVRAN